MWQRKLFSTKTPPAKMIKVTAKKIFACLSQNNLHKKLPKKKHAKILHGGRSIVTKVEKEGKTIKLLCIFSFPDLGTTSLVEEKILFSVRSSKIKYIKGLS